MKFEPVPILIDGKMRQCHVARLTQPQLIEMRARTEFIGQRAHRRAGLLEAAKDDAEYALQQEAALREQLEAAEYYANIIGMYVSVNAGEMHTEEGDEVRTGEELVRSCGGNRSDISEITSTIMITNMLGPDKKKDWKVRLVSKPGPGTPKLDTAEPGKTAAIAGSAAKPDTKDAAAATA